MKALTEVQLVQYSFWDYETLRLSRGGTAFIGPNGAGKTSLVDAIQIALIGGDGRYMQFNAQSVHKDSRSLRDYALGTMRSGEGDKGTVSRKRTEALSYITLVFRDDETAEVVSAGICVWSSEKEPQHRTLGLFITPGVHLALDHHLVDLGDQGNAPQDWHVFESQLRSLAASAGRQPTITTKPETYVDELLHNIGDPKMAADPAKFRKALRQSIRLKDVSSINDFLRENLIDTTRIDRKPMLQHIQTQRNLALQIAAVKEQLAQLDLIAGRYERLAREHRNVAVARAVIAQLQCEAADKALSDLQITEARLATELQTAEAAEAEGGEAVKSSFNEYEKLLATFNSDPDAAAPQMARELSRSKVRLRDRLRQEVEGMELRIGDALTSAAATFEGRYTPEAEGLAKAARIWESRRSQGELASPAHAREALRFLARVQVQVGALATEDEESQRRAAEAKGAVEEKIKAAAQGVKVKDNDVAQAMHLFSREGINHHTVASVVTVRDPDWQGAIETFLGRNRYALVVAEGREQEATGILRRHRVPEVAVVQPNHLRDVMGRRPEAESVVALLQSDDQVALAYLSRLLGRMRCVDTEAELEEHPRSLTRDCMLSANGGTKMMRPLAPGDWLFGMQVSSNDRAGFRTELQEAHEVLCKAHSKARLSRDAQTKIDTTLASLTAEIYAARIEEHRVAADEARAAADPAAVQLPEHLQKLQLLVNEARQRHIDARDAHGSLTSRVTRIKTQQQPLGGQIATAQATLEQRQTEQEQACIDVDYDAEHVAMEIDLAYQTAAAGGDAIAEQQDRAAKAARSIDKLLQDAVAQFVGFINEQSIGLIDERSDWRKAATWVEGHIEKLRNSTLVEYEQQAQEARAAAEKAFESEIKFKLREALHRLEREIRDLNAILDRCPPFTNDEQYHFVARLDEQHRPLYNLITRQVDDGSVGLFDAGAQDSLLRLLEATDLGTDKGNNPLEDYRLFYQFDLQIRVNGAVVDVLSKRMGLASNGEHRVPFYVIAGAMLATAYRFKPGVQHRGAGVMILDEAFYGIDAQNTVVTADFLKSLGLQLVIAAPDYDLSKLTPTLDNYYELFRFGPDIITEHVVVKERARKLMQSDMPSLNPGLLEGKVEQLMLAAK